MAAIAGILAFQGAQAEPGWTDTLTAALHHRGPDGCGRFSEGPVSLVHCALAIAPAAPGTGQPAHDLEARCTVVFDGRLDNRQELVDALGLPAADANGSDAALVLAAYTRWGEDAASHLLGDFAFALWDDRHGQLYCARDPAGAGAFAFHRGERFFAFASESEALARLPGVSAAPNELLIAQLLVPGYEDQADRRTWLKDVEALLPGECLCVSAAGALTIRRYWEPDLAGVRRYASYGACEEHFLAVFGEAVKDRLRGTDGVAMMLSGGLDSAGLLAMSRRRMVGNAHRTIDAYSAVDDDAEACIESRSIHRLAGDNGARLHTVAVPSMSGMVTVEDLDRAAWAGAHPVANSILLPQLMCLAASRDGHKVLLHGACGDLAMAVPRYYPSALLRRGKLLSAWRESLAASAHNLLLQGRSPGAIYLHSAARAVSPTWLTQAYRSWRFKRRAPAVAGSLVNPEFAARIRLDERIAEEFRQGQKALRSDPQRLRIDRCLEHVCSGLSGYGLVAGRHGVEVRDPWSDRRVLDFMFRLPDEFKSRHGWTKYLVRSAFEPEIAPFVRQRKDKTHLGWKMVTRALDIAHPRLSAAIEGDLSAVEGYIDVAAFRARAQPFVRRKDQSDYLAIFEILTLQLWLNRIGAL